MGNVPISCCRSKSPRLDSDPARNRNGPNAQYTSTGDHSSSVRRKFSAKSTKVSGCANESSIDQSRSLQSSSQNILQHISEREPDDNETDPSSNPLNRPIFATRSTCSKSNHCKLSASSSTSNYNDSYSSNLSSSLARRQTFQNTPLINSSDQGYNSSASTNLTHYDGSLRLATTESTTNTSFGGNSIAKDDEQQKIADKINEQIHGLSIPKVNATADDVTASPNRLIDHASPIHNAGNDILESRFSMRRYLLGPKSQNVEYCVNRFKASSCSTIFIDDSTISQPNLDQTIKCVSLAIYYHIQDRTTDGSLEIFDESIHPLKMPSQPVDFGNGNNGNQKDELIILDPTKNRTNGISTKDEKDANQFNLDENPDQETIYEFVRTLFRAAQLTSEYAITTLVYLERLMTYAEIELAPKTWRRMFLGAILLSSKVWEDQAVWNVDYAQILEEISVDDINELERQFLELIQFNMNVPSSVYAKYYFHLRTLAIKNGLTEEQSILTTGKARDLEAMSNTNATSGEWFSSTIERKSENKSIKKHTSLERLRQNGLSRAVLM